MMNDSLVSRQAVKDIMFNIRTSRYNNDKHFAELCLEEFDAIPSAYPETITNCHDLISKRDAYLALVEKGQASRRYKLGETWELNGKEIREVLDALPSALQVDEGYLIDWYISSVDDSEPVWTEAHIEELMNDFYLIPKEY